MAYVYECPMMVQTVLDECKPGQQVLVDFVTVNGETRQYVGSLDHGANRSQSVAIHTGEGWKRFNVNNVINIDLL